MNVFNFRYDQRLCKITIAHITPMPILPHLTLIKIKLS